MLSFPSRRKKSKKLFVLATIAAAAVFSSSYYFLSSFSNDIVVAKVNGQKIFKSEVELKLHDVFDNSEQASKTPEINSLPKEVIEILAKEIYLERELNKQAAKSKAAKSAEIKARIEDSKNKIIRQAYINSILEGEITSEKINAKYLELSKELEGKKEYQVFHIVVKTKEEAEKIVKELKTKRTKFADLAKKYSIDQDSASKGGDLDYVLEDSLIKEISDVVTNLKKDEISQPIETKFGWHIVKIGDVRDAKALSFEDVKDNIKDQLIQDKLNELNGKIIDEAKIQILIELKEIKKSQPDKEPTAEVTATPEKSESEIAAADEDSSQAKIEEEKTDKKAEKNKSKSDAKSKDQKKSKRD